MNVDTSTARRKVCFESSIRISVLSVLDGGDEARESVPNCQPGVVLAALNQVL